MRPKDRLGRAGERLAVEWLQSRGLRILECNRLIGPGELDIVARDGDCLVFVEVKTRHGDDGGGAAAAVGESKRRSLYRSAQVYVSCNALDGLPMRFDVIAVTWPENEEPRIEHFRDAFDIPADW